MTSALAVQPLVEQALLRLLIDTIEAAQVYRRCHATRGVSPGDIALATRALDQHLARYDRLLEIRS